MRTLTLQHSSDKTPFLVSGTGARSLTRSHPQWPLGVWKGARTRVIWAWYFTDLLRDRLSHMYKSSTTASTIQPVPEVAYKTSLEHKNYEIGRYV